MFLLFFFLTWTTSSPVWQSTSEMILDVVVHDGFEVLEFTVLQQIDDVHLRRKASGFSSTPDLKSSPVFRNDKRPNIQPVNRHYKRRIVLLLNRRQYCYMYIFVADTVFRATSGVIFTPALLTATSVHQRVQQWCSWWSEAIRNSEMLHFSIHFMESWWLRK